MCFRNDTPYRQTRGNEFDSESCLSPAFEDLAAAADGRGRRLPRPVFPFRRPSQALLILTLKADPPHVSASCRSSSDLPIDLGLALRITSAIHARLLPHSLERLVASWSPDVHLRYWGPECVDSLIEVIGPKQVVLPRTPDDAVANSPDPIISSSPYRLVSSQCDDEAKLHGKEDHTGPCARKERIMALHQLVPPAMVLGIANHVYFHHFEPKTAHYPLLLVAIQPFLIAYLRSPLGITFTNILVASTILITTLLSSIVIYRLGPWHPLAHIPGPTLAKVSKWWAVRMLVKGDKYLVMKELHDKYGDFVRTGPNEVSIIHADAIRAVLGTGGFQKGPYYEPFSDSHLPSRSLLNLRGDAHANRRKIWNRGMSSESLKGYEGILADRVQIMLDQFDRFVQQGSGKGMVDMAAWCSYLTFDFMGDMAFGGGFDMLRDGEDRGGIFSIIKIGIKATAIIAQIPWIAPTVDLIPGLNSVMNALRNFAYSSASNRVKSGPKVNKDLWYHLMDEDGHEKVKPTMPEVLVDGVLAIVAGSDTSAFALSYFFWTMLTNPDVFARVKAEVDSVYPDPEAILRSERQNDLKFLNACLQETLRLFPPVPTGGSREIPTGDPKLIAGKLIPQHTNVSLPAYVIHRSPKHFFPAPDTFDPDRWLRERKDSSEVLNQSVLLTFSYGAANCAAKHLAWRELIMATSALVRRYDMRFVPGKESGEEGKKWIETLGDIYVTETGKLMVEISSR
uniref:Cytochrome P450 n=1 Tax=Mycena chlorophos TaxID=658473 RepID=A0ABQ0L033_MYCCL|nr:predicted protein [Mycena chlorophos]